jgi:Putative polyhydroxyalkanoic acid system protein (PHA_gran_rgn)
MPVIDFTREHRRSLEDARRALQDTVSQVTATFSTIVSRVEWSTDRDRVNVDGIGLWVEMTVDARVFHATGDMPVLGRLLGSRFPSDLTSRRRFKRSNGNSVAQRRTLIFEDAWIYLGLPSRRS